jgi:hypothetical protein
MFSHIYAKDVEQFKSFTQIESITQSTITILNTKLALYINFSLQKLILLILNIHYNLKFSRVNKQRQKPLQWNLSQQ